MVSRTTVGPSAEQEVHIMSLEGGEMTKENVENVSKRCGEVHETLTLRKRSQGT